MKIKYQKLFLSQLLIIVIYSTPIWAQKNQNTLKRHNILVDGSLRKYIQYTPEKSAPKKGYSVLFALHGGGGKAKNMAQSSRYHQLSISQNWIVVYPQAKKHQFKSNWNDGRVHTQAGKEKVAKINDVQFMMKILEKIQRQLIIDPKRIYATGNSNGAYMVQKLAAQQAETFSAIAAVIGSMSLQVAEGFMPKDKLSVLMINGTKDPLVPYQGGMATFRKHKLGLSLPIQQVVDKWVKHNQLDDVQTQWLHNINPDDHCTVERQSHTNSSSLTEVVLLTLHGSGHTIAGKKQYAPVKLVGHTCQDFNANETIVDFFNNHSK